MQVVYLVKGLTIVFHGLTGIVFQTEKKGSCLTSAWNTELYCKGERSGKFAHGVQNIKPVPPGNHLWGTLTSGIPTVCMYIEHIACWFRKWGQTPFGIFFPRNQSLLVRQTSRWDKLRQVQQVITSIPFLNSLSAFIGQNYRILNSRIKVHSSCSSSHCREHVPYHAFLQRDRLWTIFNYGFFQTVLL